MVTKYIHVSVIVNAKKEKFVQKNEGHFLISVKEKAERNMANARVLELVAEHFKISKNKVRIINGHRSPSKILGVDF
ncbi:hypothetical protein A2914_00185 [Candidatus Nomurabacteria bacterium RIFCSPLOWO2_01_FULL_41_21]|uniref:YggU family protein n=2 Tax=Candidatus Nomuraibacteriota TaxID=1752729 RepID=A0A1F6V369_9BACT|nr:MAG: hypothetical protein A2733_02590 [Candidatus Nomurabacteria bacterium RIFCSPHIGHO2_01_FULL_40_20]OGI88775.1 MAG: hypothetical protein A2914_00185 [Candidatus Nomurabacteria bacterium RIFCSPLOWO2_01_FULL_41_21]